MMASLHAQNSECVSLDNLIERATLQNPEIVNDSARKVFVLKIKKTWYNWLYAINTAGILNEYYNLLSDLDRISRYRYESGDIDYMQYSQSSDILARLTVNKATFENKSQQFKNTMTALTLNDPDIFPCDTAMDLYEIDKTIPFEYDSNSDSLSSYREFAKTMEIDNLQLELDNLFISLSYYRSYGLVFALGIRETALARLKSEDIDYLEYADYMEKSLKTRLEFFEVLNRYNQCAIQLEEYAY